VATGKAVRVFSEHPGGVCTVAFSSDGRLALSGGRDYTVKLWEIATGRKLRTFTGHMDWVNAVAFSPDGKLAFSASADKSFKIWDVASSREIRSLDGDADGMTCLTVDKYGRVLTGGLDGVGRLWDFPRSARYRDFEPEVAGAAKALQDKPDDAMGQASLGQWYAFRGKWIWAVELLEKARTNGAGVSPLALARCYWELDDGVNAGQEFRRALEKKEAPEAYLKLCLQAATNGPSAEEARERFASLGQDKILTIIAGLKGPSLTIRRAAIDAIAGIGPPAIPALIAALKDQNPLSRLNASAALASMSDMGWKEMEKAGPALIESLTDANEGTRANAAHALGGVSKPPKAILSALVGAASDKSAVVRRASLDRIATFGAESRAAVPVLLKLLKNDDDGGVRQVAAYDLGEIGTQARSVVPALLEALKNPNNKDSFFQAAIVEAIGKFGAAAKEAIPALTKAAEESDSAILSVRIDVALENIRH
jgi:HEAT repeat protein